MADNKIKPFPKRTADDDSEGSKPPMDVSGKRLKSLIERVERLEQEKADLAADIKDIYAEAKAVGYDVKIVRRIVRLRKMDEQKRREEDEILELYKSALGME